jgi:replicative DNA helicase
VTDLRGKPHVRLAASCSRRGVLREVQELLLRFGIHGRISATGANRKLYRLWIHGVDQQQRFLSEIGVDGPKAKRLDDALAALGSQRSNPNVDTIPCEVRDLVVAELARAELTQRDLAALLGEQYCGGYLLGTDARPRCSSRGRLERIADVLESKELGELANSEVMWDEVVEVIPRGEQPTYDATVAGTHNFVANGVVAHNSIEQDADVVMFLYRESVYSKELNDDTTEVIVAKHRAGPTATVQLMFQGYCTRFDNLDNFHD